MSRDSPRSIDVYYIGTWSRIFVEAQRVIVDIESFGHS